jgi:RND family efflux transporter MFP subunit
MAEMTVEKQPSTPPIVDNTRAGNEDHQRRPNRLITILLCVVIIAAGVGGAAYLKKSSPRAQKRPPERVVPIVEAISVAPTSERVMISAMGSVVPARTLILKSRVGGEIVSIHPEFNDGGVVRKGEVLVELDGKDYRLAIARQKSALADADYALKLELGHQEVARREWDLINAGKPVAPEDEALALRKPHLAKARADLAAAEAELKQAQLNLSRTVIRAPFNAMIRDKRVAVGSQIAAQETLAELVGTDSFWVEVPVAVDRLQWIRIPKRAADQGAPAQITYRNGHTRAGSVTQLLGELASEGRMARLLVTIPDPLQLAAGDGNMPRLLIGEYVRVAIAGRTLDGVYRLPRTALRDNRHIWVMAEDGTLDIRAVTPVWRTSDDVLLGDDLKPGDRVIVSDLPNPVQGLPVTTRPVSATQGS